MKVTIYTVAECKFSKEEKEYLTQKGIQFEEKNVEQNKEWLQEMLAVGNNFAGTPVTKIEKDDGQISVLKGFTKEEFDKILASGSTDQPADQGTDQPATQIDDQPSAPPADPTVPPVQQDGPAVPPAPTDQPTTPPPAETPTPTPTDPVVPPVVEPTPPPPPVTEPQTPSTPPVTPPPAETPPVAPPPIPPANQQAQGSTTTTDGNDPLNSILNDLQKSQSDQPQAASQPPVNGTAPQRPSIPNFPS